MRIPCYAGWLLLLAPGVVMAAQSHVVAWGSWKLVTLASGQQIKVHPLVIDGRVKEYSAESPHQVTETLTVARRVFRINSALPNPGAGQEKNQDPQWEWELGGWMSVNSNTGHIAELKLPEFDPKASEASWFQDYAAYCGATESGDVRFMMIFQIGKRKPALQKELPGRSCPAPEWSKNPTRVTFLCQDGKKVSFTVHDNIAELQRTAL